MSIISIATELHPAAYPCSIAEALPLFKTFNRISYKAANGGVEAPEFDPNRDVKLWLDTAAKSGHTTYETLKTDAQGAYIDPPSFVPMYLPVVIAATVNLPPGPSEFPAWDPPPSDALIVSGGVPVSGIDPMYLSDAVQADDLYADFEQFSTGGVQLWTPDPGPGNIHVEYGTDPRREYQFVFKTQLCTVGLLLKQMYVNGVGAPGNWDTSGEEPRWIPEPPPVLPSTFKVTPMPMRKLLAGESFDILPVGGLMIQKVVK